MGIGRKERGVEGEVKKGGWENIMTTVVVGYTIRRQVCSYFWWADAVCKCVFFFFFPAEAQECK